MYLIGVIEKNKEITRVLKEKINKSKIIDLNLNIIENYKNIKFDVILISNLEKHDKSNYFKKILANVPILVLNTDIKENLSILDNLQGKVITYGFNSKATITASSVNESYISICIQRMIENIKGEKIEPIEYVENIEDIKNIEISDIIGIKTMENLLT